MITHDMKDDEYHSRPELSSTGARMLLPDFKGSPAKYRWNQTHPRANTRSYDIGHAVHAKVLGTGLQAIAYPEELLGANGAASTKVAKEWAVEQRTNGFVPMKAVEVNVINAITEAVLANPDARTVLEQPYRETSIFTRSPEGVDVRARFDIYGTHHAGDLKTTTDASPRGFMKHVVEYGYHVQQAWYEDCHEFETGNALESFQFIAVETSGPYQVAVHTLDGLFRHVGAKLAREARDRYAECKETNTWPGVKGETLTPPTWMLYEHDELMVI